MASKNCDYLFKLVIVGDSCVGKTSLLLRYTDNCFAENYLTTIGCDFKTKTMELQDKIITLQMWDTSGQERFRALASSFYRNADGLLIVYDVTNPESFSRVTSWLQEAEYYSGKHPIKEKLLVGNKCDLETERKVDSRKAQTVAQQMGMQYVETSAKNKLNVTQAFESMTQRMLDSLGSYGMLSSSPRDSIRLDNARQEVSPEYQGYCCSYV